MPDLSGVCVIPGSSPDFPRERVEGERGRGISDEECFASDFAARVLVRVKQGFGGEQTCTDCIPDVYSLEDCGVVPDLDLLFSLLQHF